MGWPVSKQAAYHGLFQNGPNKKLLLIGLTGVKMGWPVLKWAARFKMGQITNRAVTYIRTYMFGYMEVCRDLSGPCSYVLHYFPGAFAHIFGLQN